VMGIRQERPVIKLIAVANVILIQYWVPRTKKCRIGGRDCF